jgi:hypothetical protein
MRTSTHGFRISTIELVFFLLGMLILLLLAAATASGQSKTYTARNVTAPAPIQQQLYREYRGVRLNMTAAEVRAKLGEPAFKSDDQDFYTLSANETAQFVYDAAHKVVTISTDYTGGAGAPDYKAVVGEGLLQRPDGSLFRMVFFQSEGFWVSYNKSASVVPIVTITISIIK